MSLYERIERDGLTPEQAPHLFQQEMIRYRNMLEHQHASIQGDGEGEVRSRLAQMLDIYAALNNDFAVNGFADYMDIAFIGGFDRRFRSLDDEAREHLLEMLGRAGELPDNLLEEASDLLQRAGIAVTGQRPELARRIMCEARAVAARSYGDAALQQQIDALRSLGAVAQIKSSDSRAALRDTVPSCETDRAASPPPQFAMAIKSDAQLSDQQRLFATLTPLEAVDEYMRLKPKTGGVRGKTASAPLAVDESRKPRSKPKVWGDSQRRQFRAAAWLFGKSHGGKPLAACSQDDLNDFYDRLNRIPSSHHKSPRHEQMSLEEICEEAQLQIAYGSAGHFTVGLDVGTINRHFANLKKLCTWLGTKIPIQPLDFSDYILIEEDNDERTERDPYTIEQGRELFQLPIWTGSSSLEDRFTPHPGGGVWHDAAYWVMPIVWYSGMRREEACKLLVEDIGEEDGIPFFNIRATRAGRVKTSTSVRKVPICNELRRLGILEFVAAMKEAGEDYLFPEILPGRGDRALGDVYFKNIWLKMKPHLKLMRPGQAVHSGRHMVSTELKMLQAFEEFRSDLLGQKSGGENSSRYASASRLQVLNDVVERIPIVTSHLPNMIEIKLLPKGLRQPRPIRETSGRRKRV